MEFPPIPLASMGSPFASSEEATAASPVLPQVAESSTPHPRLQLHEHFRSDLLPDARNLIVYLPPQYRTEPDRRFPVLYMHDGQNLFDGQTSYIPGRTWRMQEAADAAIEASEAEPLIIVGIYNTGSRRIAEYTPTRDWKMGGGEASAYGRLIVEELMPYIQQQYRTLAGREHTGIGGSSLGGLVSLYFGLQYPQVFSRLAVHSPSVWWNHRSILALLRETRMAQLPRVWLDVGDAEGARTTEDTALLDRQLRKQGWQEGQNLHYQLCYGGRHDEESWAARVRPMLRFLFPAAR